MYQWETEVVTKLNRQISISVTMFLFRKKTCQGVFSHMYSVDLSIKILQFITMSLELTLSLCYDSRLVMLLHV